ncbi:unnamed protein product [Effrenium voratum]|uniref:Uncharacterized protein n=1 Tax=Effrenium voratum TaxID=2562239 RepID=A0AA36N7X1_9DINO|nr:unnamed protein product [Effrenium voratum]
MQKSARGVKKSRRGAGETQTQNAVPFYSHFAKSVLRPFPDSAGNFLWIPRGKGAKTEQDLLKPARLAKSRSSANCEALGRMPTYLSEEGACVAHAAEYLKDNLALEKFGAGFVERLREGEGAKFVEACCFFNKDDETEKDVAKAAEHVANYLDFLTNDPEAKIKEARRMVLCAARMFVLGASALEQMALAQHPEEWAQQMNTEKQPAAAAGAFKKKPTAKRYRALLEAAAASLLSEQSLTRKRKKPKLEDSSAADSEDEEATDKEDSSEESGQQHGSISSDEKKKKKKKQKTKEAAKERDRKKADKSKQKGKDKAKPASAEVLVDSPEPEDPDEEQTQALSKWQLSEIQSAEGEWQLFKEVLKSAAATQEDFAKHLNYVPVEVREAFGVKVKKLPAKAEARGAVAQRMQDIIAAGKSFWAAQQAQPLPQE